VMQGVQDMEPPDQSAGLWLTVMSLMHDKDTETLTAIVEQLIQVRLSLDGNVKDMNGAADDLEQHAQDLYEASAKAKAAATYGTEDVAMAEAFAQYVSLEKLAGAYRSAGANYRAAAAALQTISDGVDEFAGAVNDRSWSIAQDLAVEQYKRDHAAPTDR